MTKLGASDQPKRSKGERMLVIAVIVVMLVVVFMEANSYSSLNQVTQELKGELAKTEQADVPVRRADLTKRFGDRRPDESYSVKAAAGEELYELYYFRGPLSRRVLCVHYGVIGAAGDDRDVVEIITDIPAEILSQRKS